MDKVSIVIPAFNEKSTISSCISSVLANSWSQLEVIIVDDASTDGTTEELRNKWANHSKVKIVHKMVRGGACKACNTGIEHADSDFVFFTGSDCIVSSNWIAEGMDALSAEGVVAVEGVVRLEQDTQSIREKYPAINPFYPFSNPLRDFANGCFCCKTSAIQEVGKFDCATFLEGREDTDFGYRLSQVGTVAFNSRMVVTHANETWTLNALLENAKRYQADVQFYKKHQDFGLRWGFFLHPYFLLLMIFPVVIPFRYPIRSLNDILFIPQFYLYLIVLRFYIWKASIQLKVFLV